MLTLTAPRLESPLYALAAVIGTIGLVWAILGVEPAQRWIVIVLLAIGVSAVAWRLVLPVAGSLGRALSSSSQSHPNDWFRLPLLVWLVLGPLVVGILNIVGLIRQAVRSPNNSLDQTR
jgi:hypothetical protein